MNEALKDLRMIVQRLKETDPMMGLILEQWVKDHIVQVHSTLEVNEWCYAAYPNESFDAYSKESVIRELGREVAKCASEIQEDRSNPEVRVFRATVWVVK